MKLAITPLVFAAAVMAQGYSTAPAPEGTESAPAPEGTESMPAPEATGSMPIPEATGSMPIPEVSMPTILSETQIGGGSQDVFSLLSRLISYFDLSRVSASMSSVPVIIGTVYDPVMNKFTFLSSGVVQSGDSYYVPVCPVADIVAAGMNPVMSQSSACTYGMQLTPMPSNAASGLFKVLRLKIRLFLSLLKPSFWLGRAAQGSAQMTRPGAQLM
ncbi:hypothetical protein LPJ70_004477 [Coemansia sp. RSA 2708]|nr:hypothetical protein LPJ70_004477 [Coemansia sp. RSA 2708]